MRWRPVPRGEHYVRSFFTNYGLSATIESSSGSASEWSSRSWESQKSIPSSSARKARILLGIFLGLFVLEGVCYPVSCTVGVDFSL